MPLTRKSKLATSIDQDIQILVQLIQAGIDAWTRAGQMLVEMINRDPQVVSKLMSRHPSITLDMIQVFEGIGRRKIYAPLLAKNSPASRRLLEMPYELQEKYSHAPIDVVVELKPDDKPVIMKRSLDEMPRSEISKVFGFESIYSVEQQIKNIKQSKKYEPIYAPPVLTVNKPIPIGFFKIRIDADGSVSISKSQDNGRSHFASAIRNSDGSYESVVSLFKKQL